MNRPDALDAMLLDLHFEAADARVATVDIPDVPGLPVDESELRSILVAGLFDLVAEAVTAASVSNLERSARVREALSRVQSIIPVARFALYERAGLADRQELLSRMRGREVAMTRTWLVPKLEAEIAAYAARIDSLGRALEEA